MPQVQILPDVPDEDLMAEERTLGILRNLMSSCPDLNHLLQDNVVISTRGPLAMCLGTLDVAMLAKVGFKA